MNPIYENEWVKLYQGDCLEIMPQLDMKFDCCITDLPYGTTHNKWDSIVPFEPMWKELKRLVKDNGAICLFGSEPFSSALRMSNIPMFKYDWTWDKKIPSGMNYCKFRPMQQTENISVFGKGTINYHPQMIKREKPIKETTGSKKTTNQIMPTFKYMGGKVYEYKNPINLIEFQRVPNASGTLHPTQKPISLIEYFIRTYTNEGEIVLDFTSGSGTTGVACMETNRKCVLIEKEEKYCEITIKRLQDKEKEMAERLF